MAKTQSTEYQIRVEGQGVRDFESRAKARDFIEEDKDKIQGKVEKRVWDHTECGSSHAWCEIDDTKSELISVDEFMAPRR